MPVALLVLAALAVACTSEKARPPSTTWSCYTATTHNCREYRQVVPAGPAGIDSLRSLCSAAKTATFTSAPCPVANTIGRCTKSEYIDVFYVGYPFRPQDLPMACTTAGGTFSE